MDLPDEFGEAEKRMAALRKAGYAVSARYDKRTARIFVNLNTEIHLSFPVKLAEGLAGASAEALADIEITPSGLGLHWPRLDADIYMPALMRGEIGSKTWMAQVLGKSGGLSRTTKKGAAARENGKKGGRPRKAA